MPSYTRTFQAVLGGPTITVDPILASKSHSSSDLKNVSVCARCSGTIFSPTTWAHLRGDTLDPPIPAVDSDTSDYHIMNDLDFVVQMFNAREGPKKRGPMVDFKIPGKDILKSSQELCGFCRLLVKLAEGGALLAEHDQNRVLRLQAFWPEKANGCMHPMMLEVGLHPDISGGGDVWPLTFYEGGVFTHRKSKTSHTVVGSHSSLGPGTSLLVESTDVVNRQYAVLSYVWGTSNAIRLSGPTLSKLKEGLDFDELPQTIQETVLVTDALSIRYLWIDSLCILQDSKADKSQEIPRMNEYYQNALIVISASGAEDVHSGFLCYQETYHDVYTKLNEPEPTRQYLTGSVPLKIPGHFHGYSTSLLVDTVPTMYTYKHEPINNRAWTLQESVLPRRLLTFPKTGGLSMRCLKGEVLVGEIISNPYHETPSFISSGILVSSSERTGDELIELWNTMVEDYTQRSLSYRSDILIAIGALAREFHRRYGALLGRYLGGLWEKYIRSNLLWHNTQGIPVPQTSQENQYFAPSWSWASCPQPTVFRNKPEMFLPLGESVDSLMMLRMYSPRWYCEVLSAEVTPQSELDHFGALRAGYLTIQGPLRPLQRHPVEERARTKTENKSHGCPNLYLEEAWSAAESLILDRPLDTSDSARNDDEQYYWLGLWYAGRGRARGLIFRQINETDFQRLGYAEYVVDETAFPSSETHNERVIRLV